MNKYLIKFGTICAIIRKTIVIILGMVLMHLGRFPAPIDKLNSYPIVIFAFGYVFFAELLGVLEWFGEYMRIYSSRKKGNSIRTERCVNDSFK